MNYLLKWLIIFSLRIAIRLRYKVKYKGLREVFKKTGGNGILFLADITTELDPLLMLLGLFPALNIKTLISKDLYNLHWIKVLDLRLGAISVPPYLKVGGTYQATRIDQKIAEIREGLLQGEHYLVFPTGQLKITEFDQSGSKLAYELLKDNPGCKVMLIKIHGMKGSAFSHRVLGLDFKPVESLWACFKTVLKNGIFFMPRRKVVIEFAPPPEDFPYQADKQAMNAYLQAYYNGPFDPGRYGMKAPVKGCYLVPHFFWQKEVELKPHIPAKTELTLADVSDEIKEDVLAEIAKLSKKPVSTLSFEQNLFMDLELSSLDVTELLVFLEEKYSKKADFEHLKTIEDVVLTAAGRVKKYVVAKEVAVNAELWAKDQSPRELGYPEADTIIETFLKICDRQGNALACADYSFLMSYNRMKSLIVGLAKEFQALEGKNVGVLMASSQMMNIIVLALMLAHKVPVMINWTLGNRHLEEVIDKAEIKAILTMGFFLKMITYPLSPKVQSCLLSFEEIREAATTHEKRKGLNLTRESADKILKHFHSSAVKGKDPAVILFTSGTEKSPKGVPLSSENLLSNQKAAIQGLEFTKEDVVFGLLPSFHVFGFSITNILPLLYGVRVVYHANPLDMKAALDMIPRWKITIVCTTPTFLKVLLALGNKELFKNVRLFIVGAEKTPKELFQAVADLGTGAKLIEGYGITECSPIVTLNKLNEEPNGVGYPLEGVELLIVDPESKKPLSQGQKGLILVHGPSVFYGYLGSEKDPFLHIHNKKWYVTGDLGFINAEGALQLSGRLTRSIKLGAEMISLAAVEEALESGFKDIAHDPKKPLKLAVMGKENEQGAMKLILCCNYELSLERANAILKEAGFSNLFRLEEVKLIDPFPVFATGKVNYPEVERALRKEAP